MDLHQLSASCLGIIPLSHKRMLPSRKVLIMYVPKHSRGADLQMHMSEFWSGDLGLTLVTISLVVLVFLITPLREAGLPGRVFFELIVVSLMLSGALLVDQSRLATGFIAAVILSSAVILGFGRYHPTPFLHQLGSVA